VPLAGAVHRLRLRDERRDRVRDEAAVERVACGVDLPFAAAPARLLEHTAPARRQVAVTEEASRRRHREIKLG